VHLSVTYAQELASHHIHIDSRHTCRQLIT
jgi:hypothetical protein